MKALDLRRAGAAYRDIASALGISVGQSYNLVRRGLQRAQKEAAEQGGEVKQMELERLDRMFRGVWVSAMNGTPAAIDRALRIMERRARLLGLDAPAKQEHAGVGGSPLFSKIEVVVIDPPKE